MFVFDFEQKLAAFDDQVEPAPLTLALVSLGAVVGSALLVQLVISVLNQRAGV